MQRSLCRMARNFSTQPTTSTTTTMHNPNHRRVSRTLYRQLLRWCQMIERYDIKVMANILPPAVVEAPEYIDAYRTELLSILLKHQEPDQKDNHELFVQHQDNGDDHEIKAVRRVAKILPKQTICEKDRLEVDLKNIHDLKCFVQAMFRINDVPIEKGEASDLRSEELNQKRRDVAFDKLRKLNELHKHRIFPLKDRHTRNADRNGVLYRIGEVVQHRTERWRGVIASWERGRKSKPISNDFGSLTTKSYPTSLSTATDNDGGQMIRYSVILDVGDAYALTSLMASGVSTMTAAQSELEAVTDEHLTRIRNDVLRDAFPRFDASTHCFVANEILQYEFPSDQLQSFVGPTPETIDLCNEITMGVKAVAEQLDSLLLEAMKENVNSYSALTNSTTTLWRILKRISRGDVYPEGADPKGMAPTHVTALHLRALTDVLGRILEAMFQRRQSIEKLDVMQFQVGDIVRHLKYGFRGVVVAWDATPALDVSNWDGVQDIENVMDLPFYTIIPDKNDCIQAFGGERNMRYVCQANLELCPGNEQILNVDLGPGWQAPSPSETRYTPPVGLSFAYGSSVHEEEKEMEENMSLMEKAVNDVYLGAQKADGGLSLKNLVNLLQKVDNFDDAAIIQDAIKEIRKANSKLELRSRLECGVAALVAGKQDAAAEFSESVVAEDPCYAEAWNKLGTCRYVRSDHDGAKEAFQKALALDDINNQAMASLGLISFDQGNYAEAADWFRKSLVIDPWAMTSTRLSACVDLLKREGND